MSVREAIEADGFDAFGELLAPDVVWVGLHPGELCRNRGDVLVMLENARAKGISARAEIVLERDDALVVDPHLDGRHHVIVLHDGLVSEVLVYRDREAAVSAIEGRPW